MVRPIAVGPFSSRTAASRYPGDEDGEDIVVALAYVLGAVGLVAIIAGIAAYRRAASDGWQIFGIVGGTLGADLVVIAAALALG
jgi:hypothetical protein